MKHNIANPTRAGRAALACLAAIALLAACATPPAAGPAGADAFAAANLASFRTFTLSNGVPVVVKINPDNRIYNLRLVLKGGSALTTPANAGIEGLMLATMARGSADWPYARLMAEFDATSSGIGAGAGFDGSEYTLNTLDKYFGRVFPIWADTVIRPGFTQADFDQMRTNAIEALEGVEQDAWSKLAKEMNKVFFTSHPYAQPADGTLESIKGLTLDDVKRWYAEKFSAKRLMVVAVGNFDVDALKADLDKTIGAIPAVPVALPAPVGFGSDAAPKSNPGGLTVVDYPPAQGIAYLRGDFPVPGPADPDYTAAQIAFKMFGDLLFEVLRTRHSAVYTPGANIRGFAANYGSITIYKTSVAKDIKAYIDEALAPLLAGRCLATKAGGEEAAGDASGALRLEPIASALPIYVAQYINEVYAAQQTNASVAAQIAGSALYYGDHTAYLRHIARLKTVSAADVERVIRKILVDGTVTWGLLGDQTAVAGVDAAAFKDFSGALSAAK
jgi:predicted Zn-dependent peptidase